METSFEMSECGKKVRECTWYFKTSVNYFRCLLVFGVSGEDKLQIIFQHMDSDGSKSRVTLNNVQTFPIFDGTPNSQSK